MGKIKIKSFSLGTSAVLFAGLGLSALMPELALPKLIYVLGLVLFVYTIGLSSGPGFFSSLRDDGKKYLIFAFVILVIGGMLVLGAAKIFHISPELAIGMYSGAYTNTPSLAAALDTLHHSTSLPVAGYSLVYPFGVIFALLTLIFWRKVWNITDKPRTLRSKLEKQLHPQTVRINRRKVGTVKELPVLCGANITVSKVIDGAEYLYPSHDYRLRQGQQITIVGKPSELIKAARWLGDPIKDSALIFDQSSVNSRRVFLSNRTIAGRKLGNLNLQDRFGVVVTRVRRGDIDMIAHDDFRLAVGDRVKIVGSGKSLHKAADFLGDSYKDSSELDILSFALGIGIGLLIGLVPFHLPGGIVFQIGASGGALIAALVLGAIGRSGPFVWQLPFSTNITLRQFGIVLFLAGIGSQGGGALRDALTSASSIVVIAVGSLLTFIISSLVLVIGYKVLRVPFDRLSGILGGIQTQPAVLTYANEKTTDEEPNFGYASVYPIVIISKIVFIQILVALLL